MKERVSRSEWLFFMTYVLWLVFATVNLTYLTDFLSIEGLFTFKEAYEFVKDVVFILLVIKFLDDRVFTLRGMMGIAILGVMYYITLQAKHTVLWLPVCFIFSARNMDWKKIFRVTLWIQGVVMFLTVSFSLLGMIPNETWDETTRMRYSLGYTYCTYGSHLFLFMTLAYMSLRKKLKLTEAIVLTVINWMWFTMTDTRIDLYLGIPAIWIVYLWQRNNGPVSKSQAVRFVYGMIGPLLGIGSVLVQWFADFTNPAYIKFSELTSGRIELGNQAIATYGFTLWGQKIRWVGRGTLRRDPGSIYNYVDSSYLKYLLHWGTIFFILLILGLIIASVYVWKSNNKALIVAYVVWTVFGAINAELIDLAFQPFVLLISAAFMEKEIDGIRPNEKGCNFLVHKIKWNPLVKWRT